MTIRDLNEAERLALLTLIEFFLESGRRSSANGAEDEVRELLARVRRPEARELIVEQAIEAATPNGIGPRDRRILTWLANQWDLSICADP